MRGLLDRLLSRNAAELLGRDALVSSVTFALGLGLMWVFVESANIHDLAVLTDSSEARSI